MFPWLMVYNVLPMLEEAMRNPRNYQMQRRLKSLSHDSWSSHGLGFVLITVAVIKISLYGSAVLRRHYGCPKK